MMPKPYANKPLLSIDFDGVIHSYDRGWQDGVIYGSVVSGFWQWAVEAQKQFRLVVHSSRCATSAGHFDVVEWLSAQERQWSGPPVDFEVVDVKPPAFVTIDDRAICFNGDWADPQLHPDKLRAFQSWVARNKAR